MNRFLTVLGVCLGVPGFLSIYINDKKMLLLSAVLAFLLCFFLFYLEGVIKSNGAEWANRVAYLLTKADDYLVEEENVIYERLSEQMYCYTVKRTLVSTSISLHQIEGKFNWSGDSSSATIKELYEGQHITQKGYDGNFTVFKVEFGEHRKNETIHSGFRIYNLIDKENRVRPFASVKARHKTKQLKISVQLANGFHANPNEIELIAMNPDETPLINPTLKVNQFVEEGSGVQHIEGVILYPRKGWRYRLMWG